MLITYVYTKDLGRMQLGKRGRGGGDEYARSFFFQKEKTKGSVLRLRGPEHMIALQKFIARAIIIDHFAKCGLE